MTVEPRGRGDPGRFRSLVIAARSLVEARDAEQLESLAAVGRPTGRAAGRPGRDAGAARRGRGRPGDDRELAELLGAGAEVSRRVTDALRPSGAQRSLPRRGRGRRPRPGEPQDPHAAGGRTPGRGPAPPRDAADGEVAWVDGTRRNVRLRLSPIDVGPALSAHALGRGHIGADQRDHPATHRRAGRPRELRHRGAERGKPVRLPLPRPALRGAAPARPARRRGGGGAARGAGPAARGGGRAHAGPLHQPAGDRGGGRGAGTRSSPTRCCCRATSPRAVCSRSSPATRPPASSPRSASGRAWTSRAARSRWSRSTGSRSHARTTRCCRPGATGPAGAPSRWSTCHGRPRCWRRARVGSSATRRTGASSPCSTHGSATASYRGVLLATLPPMRRSVDRAEVESFLRRALEANESMTGGVSSRGDRASRRGSASAARPSRGGRGRCPRAATRARRCPTP